MLPFMTEVMALHDDLFVQAQVEGHGPGTHGRMVIELDVRRRDWNETLGLGRKTKIWWEKVRSVEVRELSVFWLPVFYRITIGDGSYRDEHGERRRFGVDKHLRGVDLARGVTTAALRAAMLLAVLGCVGLRTTAWLLSELFHLEVGKSSIDRWIGEVASQLPDEEAMIKRLKADKAITEAHLDELFPRGKRHGCILVVKDEHGRILATEEVDKRDAETVVPFLTRLKSYGLDFTAFYVDGCMAYRNAIALVYPQAAIQYDYFHVLQNIWKVLGKVMTRRRRALRKEAEETDDPVVKQSLLDLAKRLWDKRGLIFKSEPDMTDEERTELASVLEADENANTIRSFLLDVWSIFRDSTTAAQAHVKLAAMKLRPEVQPKTAFAKVVKFLGGRFDDMIAFLRVPGVHRNSLAESGMRCLRRLEQGHDGFRTPHGRADYLRIYQAIRYCRWSVHRTDGLLCLLGPPLPAIEPTPSHA